MTSHNNALQEFMAVCQSRAEAALEARLPAANRMPERLHEAMRYSALGGGKRLRPLLAYATGKALGIPLEKLDGPATAVELIHVYSRRPLHPCAGLCQKGHPLCDGDEPL